MGKQAEHALNRINTTTFKKIGCHNEPIEPKTLHGNTKVKDGFSPTIKSYEEWSDTTADCIKDTLTKHLEDYVKGVEGNLIVSAHGNRLTKELLVKVVFWWNKFCGVQINRFYKELTTSSGKR
jgi:hypothetical protein